MKSQSIAEREQVAEYRGFIVILLGGLLGLYFFGYVVFLACGYFDPPTSPGHSALMPGSCGFIGHWSGLGIYAI